MIEAIAQRGQQDSLFVFIRVLWGYFYFLIFIFYYLLGKRLKGEVDGYGRTG